VILKTIDWYARRAVAWPLIIAGSLLTGFAGLLIHAGAWLTDNEDLMEEAD
jgi:hypothetical protein